MKRMDKSRHGRTLAVPRTVPRIVPSRPISMIRLLVVFVAMAGLFTSTACVYVPKGTQLVDREPMDDRRFRNLGNYSQLYVGMPKEEVLARFPSARLYWQDRSNPSNSVYIFENKSEYVTEGDLWVSNAANIAAKRKYDESMLTEEQEQALHRKDAEAIYLRDQAQSREKSLEIRPIKPKVSVSTGYFEFADDKLVSWE